MFTNLQTSKTETTPPHFFWASYFIVIMNIQTCTTFGMGITIITAFCFGSALLQLYWIRSGETVWRKQVPASLGTLPLGQPMLGVVLPLLSYEMENTLTSLKRWPLKCSAITSSRVDLIFYFAEELPLSLERLLENASVSTSCFKRTKVVSADLHIMVRFVFMQLYRDQYY